MKTKNPLRRRLFVSSLVVILSVGSWFRLTGTENIRAIHIVTLLVCGAGIGLFLSAFIPLFRKTE